MTQIAPYGSWKSPVTPEFVAGKERGLTPNLQVDGNDIYFLENRPDEAGRVVLMRRLPDGNVFEVLPREFNVRTRYLEYGGRSFLVHQEVVYFVNFADQQIYVHESGSSPRKLTQESGTRFCDMVMDEKRSRLIALREVQAEPESRNSICSIDLESGEVRDLVTGHDFFNCARLSPSGEKMLWISWDHPNMAWNGTELWVGRILSDGSVSESRKIVGDSHHGVCQARWEDEQRICFVAELENWFNLYRWDGHSLVNLHPMEAEFAFADWTPGQQQHAVDIQGRICATYLHNGRWQLVLLGGAGVVKLGEPFASVSAICFAENGFVALVSHVDRSASVISIDDSGKISELYSSSRSRLSSDEISVPEEVSFPTEDGGVGYAWYYSPRNASFRGPSDEKPPLIVKCHGGPTGMASSQFDKGVQFWTSRGYAVIDVNYGGSTGYGRAYRERLRGNWGMVDVSDCVAVVRELSKEGKIDSRRVAIRGGSAGGYTTLGALAFTSGIFSVGASYFGISDLEILAKETHKLESRYPDQLIGPYPEARAVYLERSPLSHVESLNCPIIFFQGADDKVVPPNQAQMMYEALIRKGIPTEYHLYEGEGHGFRRAENIQHSLKAEHAFYARFFGFAVSPVDRV